MCQIEKVFLSWRRMKREELAKTLARQTGLSKSAARNEVDELVNDILHKLRQGKQVKLPGVGKLLGKKSR
jgi:nucleoid DNA-binding protein